MNPAIPNDKYKKILKEKTTESQFKKLLKIFEKYGSIEGYFVCEVILKIKKSSTIENLLTRIYKDSL